jgi:hypothetical protein
MPVGHQGVDVGKNAPLVLRHQQHKFLRSVGGLFRHLEK